MGATMKTHGCSGWTLNIHVLDSETRFPSDYRNLPLGLRDQDDHYFSLALIVTLTVLVRPARGGLKSDFHALFLGNCTISGLNCFIALIRAQRQLDCQVLLRSLT